MNEIMAVFRHVCFLLGQKVFGLYDNFASIYDSLLKRYGTKKDL